MKNIYSSLFFLFSFALFSLSATAQWTPQGQGILPDDYGIADLSAVDENIVWAFAVNLFDNFGNLGIASKSIIKSVDGGHTWEVHSLEALTDRNIVSLSAVNDSIAWLSANDAQGTRYFYKTSDGGTNWEVKYTFAVNPNNLWAPILKFIDENRGYYVGISSGKAGKTTDGGDSWTEENNLPNFNGWWGVSCPECWLEIKGDSMWYGTSERIVRSINGSASWNSSFPSFPGANIIYSIAFDDNGYGLAISDVDADLPWEDGDLDHTIMWQSGNFGETWELFPQDSFPDFPLTHMVAIPGEEMSFVAVSGVWGWFEPILWQQSWASAYTTDGGLTWTVIDRDIPYGCASFASVNAGWVGTVGNFDYGYAPGNKPAVFKWEGFPVSTKNEHFESGMTLFPNPASDFLNIELPDNNLQGLEASLFDSQGRLMEWQRIIDGRGVNISHLPNGFYSLKIADGERVFVGKFVKQ